jgi:hypothetical protein
MIPSSMNHLHTLEARIPHRTYVRVLTQSLCTIQQESERIRTLLAHHLKIKNEYLLQVHSPQMKRITIPFVLSRN